MGDVFVCGAYLLNMSTAIVWVYTDNGLVIASDGRVLGHHHVITDDAQKIVFVSDENFVYATMGLSMMTTGSFLPRRS